VTLHPHIHGSVSHEDGARIFPHTLRIFVTSHINLCLYVSGCLYNHILFMYYYVSSQVTSQARIHRGLLRIAVCCSVLQRIAVCCSVLQCVAVCCSVLQCVAMCCSVLQRVAVCCSVLQCVVVCCSVLQCVDNTLQYAATHCNTLHKGCTLLLQWGVAAYCSVL